MVCKSCIDKLARRLMTHKGVDTIRAYELASKGLERVDNRKTPNPGVELLSPWDYTQPCQVAGSCYCRPETFPCWSSADCTVSECWYSCPPPLPNSHQEAVGCIPSATPCFCWPVNAESYCLGEPCTCTVSGECYYACDTGFVWNGTACVPAVPPVGYSYGDGLVTVQT